MPCCWHSFFTISRGSPERSGDLSVQLQLILGGHRVPRWSGKDTQNTATFLNTFLACVNFFCKQKSRSPTNIIINSTIKSRQAIENEPRQVIAVLLPAFPSRLSLLDLIFNKTILSTKLLQLEASQHCAVAR